MFIYGATPTTGILHFSSSIATPGSRIDLSPRNLLMIRPLIIFLSSSSRSSTVPYSCANTPPRSISPARSTGAFAIFAIPMLTRSSFLRLISAGLPAPSMTMISYSAARWSKASCTFGISCFLKAKYSLAGIFPRTSPFTITWEPISLVGFRRIGFM